MKILPYVIKHKELPQWIVSSDVAAFHPTSNTIHIKNGAGWYVYLHEYAHWLFWKLDWNKAHIWLDRI